MANILYANNAVGTLASGITNVATSLTLNIGQAALFPNPSAPQVFYVTLTDAATQTLIEIVKVTAVAGNIFSIVRGQDGTTALSWNINDIVSQRTIRLELQGFENAAEGLFGATGQNVAIAPSTTLGIVGTTLADNAAAGSVGEAISASQITNVPLTNAVTANVTSIVLTPGDWDVSGLVVFGVVTANIGFVSGGYGSTNANLLALQQFVIQGMPLSVATQTISTTPTIRYNVSVNTTVFLNAVASFSSGSVAAGGFILARRVR